MKHFLVITSRSELTVAWQEREAYVQQFCAQLKDYIDDVEVLYTTYQDLIFKVVKGETSIHDARNNRDVKEYNFVHFKNWSFELEEASVIARYLNKHSISYVNTEVNVALNLGKISQMFTLANYALPVPDSLYARRHQLQELLNNLPQGFKYPLIMKANDGSKGDDNYLIHNPNEAAEILADSRKEFIVQNFVENDGDIRVLVIGYDNKPLVFERKAVAGSHLNNTSKGGSGNFIPFESLAPQVRKDALMAAKVLNREVSGVDVLFDKNSGQHYLLEVNTTPALATGYGLEEKLSTFATFLKSQVEEKEEE